MFVRGFEMSLPTYRISRESAIWKLQDGLDISSCAELREAAMEIVANPKIRRLKLELPEGPGIPLAGFQVLRSLERELKSAGKECEISGNCVPFGVRTW